MSIQICQNKFQTVHNMCRFHLEVLEVSFENFNPYRNDKTRLWDQSRFKKYDFQKCGRLHKGFPLTHCGFCRITCPIGKYAVPVFYEYMCDCFWRCNSWQTMTLENIILCTSVLLCTYYLNWLGVLHFKIWNMLVFHKHGAIIILRCLMNSKC